MRKTDQPLPHLFQTRPVVLMSHLLFLLLKKLWCVAGKVSKYSKGSRKIPMMNLT